MEKQYSEDVEKINKRKNKILRVSLIILLALSLLFTAAMTGSALEYGSSHHTTYGIYVNGEYTGNTVTRSDNGPTLIFAFIGAAVSIAIFTVLFTKKGKDIHDFREDIEKNRKAEAAGLTNASKKRNRLYKISKYAGFTGADRFASGCILRGIVKLFFSSFGFAITISFTEILIERGRTNEGALAIGIVFLALAVFFWIKDTKALKKGTYTDRKRNCIE